MGGAVFFRQIDAVNIVIFYVCRLPLYNGELWTHLKGGEKIETILPYRSAHRLRVVLACPQ